MEVDGGQGIHGRAAREPRQSVCRNTAEGRERGYMLACVQGEILQMLPFSYEIGSIIISKERGGRRATHLRERALMGWGKEKDSWRGARAYLRWASGIYSETTRRAVRYPNCWLYISKEFLEGREQSKNTARRRIFMELWTPFWFKFQGYFTKPFNLQTSIWPWKHSYPM